MNTKLLLSALLCVMILVSGCVQIDVYQKIKRDGNVDMRLILKAESMMILNALKTDLEIDPSVQYTYKETDNSVIYEFSDIDPTEDVIFKKENAMSNKENYRFEKEFRFPYYYFTYEIDIQPEETAQDDSAFGSDAFDSEMDSMLGEMFKIGYTVEVFGDIVETNGNRMSDEKVKFNIGLTDDKVYYVKFKDFFLFTWIGSLF